MNELRERADARDCSHACPLCNGFAWCFAPRWKTLCLGKVRRLFDATQQSQMIDTRLTTPRPRLVVMDLKKRASRAATAIFTDERTAQLVALRDLART
jgi:hypothetical protein